MARRVVGASSVRLGLRLVGVALTAWVIGATLAGWVVDETFPRWVSYGVGAWVVPAALAYLWLWPVVKDPWLLVFVAWLAGVVVCYQFAVVYPEINPDMNASSGRIYTFMAIMLHCLLVLSVVLSTHLGILRLRSRKTRDRGESSVKPGPSSP